MRKLAHILNSVRIPTLLRTRQTSVFVASTIILGVFAISTQYVYAAEAPSLMSGWGGTLVKFLGSLTAVLVLPGMFLWGAGELLDKSLELTVLNFATTINAAGGSTDGTLMQMVVQIWQVSRDLANIALIGLFVFIAIATILGSTSYHLKTTLKNLVIVALLVNFSFFFAQVVMDISNWLSVLVYNTIMPTNTAASLSEILVHNMGGVEYALSVWGKMSDLLTSGKALFSIPVFLIFSLIMTVLTALLFLRIAFIFIYRFIIFILLMATSSLAVASMMIPKLGESWWPAWRDSLVYNAIIAPAMLLLLWAAVMLMQGVYSAMPSSWSAALANGNDLAALGTNDNSFVAGMVSMIIATGFLWAAIRLATMLSEKARDASKSFGKWLNTGLSWAEGLGTRGAGNALLGGWGLGGAWRNTAGRGFSAMSAAFERSAGDQNINTLRGRLQRDLFKGISAGAKAVGNTTGDPRNSKSFTDALQKGAGVALGDGIKNYTARKKEVEDSDKKLDAAAEERVREEAEKAADAQKGMENIYAEQKKALQTEQKETVKQMQEVSSALTENQQEFTKMQNEKAALENVNAQVSEVEATIKERDDLQAELNGSDSEINKNIIQQEQKIEEINSRLSSSGRTSTDVDNLATAQSHLDQLRQQRTTMADKLQNLQATPLEQRLTGLNDTMNGAERAQRLGELTAELETLKTEKDALHANRERLQAEKEATADSLNLLQEDIDANDTLTEAELTKLAGSFADRMGVVRKLGVNSNSFGSAYETEIAELQEELYDEQSVDPTTLSNREQTKRAVRIAKLTQTLSQKTEAKKVWEGERDKIVKRMRQDTKGRKDADKDASMLKKLEKVLEKQLAEQGNLNNSTQAATAAPKPTNS